MASTFTQADRYLGHLPLFDPETGTTIRHRYVVPTFARHTAHAAAVLDALRQRFDGKVTAPIRESVRIAEAAAYGRTVWDHDPRAAVADDLTALVDQIQREF